jgi:hypothetical protein
MSQDNRYVEGEPVYTDRVVTTQTVAPIAEAVEPIRRAHPGLIALALSSLLGLLSLFLPFAGVNAAWTNPVTNVAYAARHFFSFWNLGTGTHHFLLILLILIAILAIVAYVTRAAWARYAAAIVGAIAGIWLLVQSLARFSFAGLGHFWGSGVTTGLVGGAGRWIMALAGLALLATALWSLLRGRGDDVVDAAASAVDRRI